MVEVVQHVPAPPEQVFAVLADGWSYAGWVVGAAHIREVDDGFPAPGTRVHHSLGAWPAQVEGTTSVTLVRSPCELELDAGLWPLGEAHIRFELTSDGDGTLVKMHEQVTKGPMAVLPEAAQSLFVAPRNRETLKRLAALAVRSK
jgi:Polyketide cyclase / dehydrase and lipid transport